MRKLAAIMFMDIVGFTRRMEEDEARAMELLEKARQVIKPHINQYNGEWLKEMGDGHLSCFDSAVDAVNCAITIQQKITDHPDLKLRIGIHIGDVIFEADDVFGSGVNVASRIEPLAASGGICISGRVYDELSNQPELETLSLGKISLKNVDQPRYVYAVVAEGVTAPKEPFVFHRTRAFVSRWKKQLLSGTVILILLITGVWWYNNQSSDATLVNPNSGEQSVAVIPFEVSGAGSETWRDGMVTILSTGLDGVPYLRTIASRTVFAALEKNDLGKSVPSTGEALTLSRNIGAEYTVMGSAAVLGDKLQLTANVYHNESRQRIGQAKMAGKVKQITEMSNRLTRQIIAILLRKTNETIPSVDIASKTTHSLSAFKSFLEGERQFRSGNHRNSIKYYQKAIRQDSTFALAYARLALSQWWSGSYREKKNWTRAYELSDKLPSREKRLVSALYMGRSQYKNFAAAESLRHLAEDYPHDPMIWYSLGEVLWHGRIPGGYPEADKAFQKAIELDSANTPYYAHYIQLGLNLHHDSTLAARRIHSIPNKKWQETYQIALNLTFGSLKDKGRAWRMLDTLAFSRVYGTGLHLATRHPTEVTLENKVFKRLLSLKEKRNDKRPFASDHFVSLLSENYLRQGQVKKAQSYLAKMDTNETIRQISRAETVDLTIPESFTQSYIKSRRVEQSRNIGLLGNIGIYYIEQGEYSELQAILNRLKVLKNNSDARIHDSSVDTTSLISMVQHMLKGFKATKKGNTQHAITLLSDFNLTGSTGAIWRGDLYRELGQLEQAEKWYLAAWWHPITHQRLGQLYARMGKPEKAAASLRRFIKAWKNADPELQDRVARARQNLESLTSSEGESKKQVLKN